MVISEWKLVEVPQPSQMQTSQYKQLKQQMGALVYQPPLFRWRLVNCAFQKRIVLEVFPECDTCKEGKEDGSHYFF